MSVFDLIKADHKKVSDLMENFDGLDEDPDEAERQELFDQLKSTLEMHTRSEEVAVYDPLRDEDEADDLITDSFEEHGDIDQSLEEMAECISSPEEFFSKLHELKRLVLHHVAQEESALFEKMKNALTSEQLDHMAENMRAYQQQHYTPQNVQHEELPPLPH